MARSKERQAPMNRMRGILSWQGRGGQAFNDLSVPFPLIRKPQVGDSIPLAGSRNGYSVSEELVMDDRIVVDPKICSGKWQAHNSRHPHYG
ncbi:MAG: hypothetical protein K0S45_3671 [Nitrospira sp.]|nr:hypothetical protein [Nitrospira sp.]